MRVNFFVALVVWCSTQLASAAYPTPETICSTDRKDLKFYIPQVCVDVSRAFKRAAPLPDKEGRCGTQMLWETISNSSHLVSSPSEAHFIYCPAHLAHVALEHHEKLAPKMDPTGHRMVYGVNTADLGWNDFRLIRKVMAPTPKFWRLLKNSTLLSFFAVAEGDTSVCNKGGMKCKGDFRVGQDINLHAINACAEDALLARITPWRTGTWLKRNLTLYFSGRMKMSQSVCRKENQLADGSHECAAISSREQLAKYTHLGKQYIVDGMPSSYDEDTEFVKRSLFCFAPVGVQGGYGFRYVRSIMNGCIPVIMNDGRPLPYEDILDYSTFAVVIKKGGTVREMIRTLEKLKRQPEKITELHRGLAKVWKFYSWHLKTLDIVVASLHKNYCKRHGLLPEDSLLV
mmetsp:Transcript_329/g.756  ORF Transcript_329/g.756 Transcript_329/m.756 type:complete len:401 (-) Transcript_329:362-1564(-)|eukprot:CAMPEP_0118942614 /NCGR_PEP_ID=MMETSP1169-20130426/36492_1 /TAXON_ID=36882 /ORGANISM="Pyramimonas obovata, Strain CCMP722" /LENGTH=400 /DNA_ID=CAMNT_0006887657 /DNA_START=171 /DNA_END=1373 /DNA_ORIENTATION=+